MTLHLEAPEWLIVLIVLSIIVPALLEIRHLSLQHREDRERKRCQ